jgi:hypothetical protein
MPMLHGCAFPGCTTLTLSTYCVEHELLVRAAKESERAQVAEDLDPDAVLPQTVENEAQEAAQL